ncbi:MAG: DnaA/Hda family protein [Pseudomonadota bacterium]
MTPEQLSFPQPRRLSFAAADFHEGTASETARSLLAGTEAWPRGKLVLVGESGSGKTHLAHIWAAAHKGALIDVDALVTRATTPVVVDGADYVAGRPEAEETLFHLHNNLAALGLPLLLTARSAPAQWGITLPDLRSRMEATTVAQIEPPDDATLAAILGKLMEDRQLNPAPGLAVYLTRRMGRSYGEAGRIVAALDTLSLAEKRSITTALAARVLDASGE